MIYTPNTLDIGLETNNNYFLYDTGYCAYWFMHKIFRDDTPDLDRSKSYGANYNEKIESNGNRRLGTGGNYIQGTSNRVTPVSLSLTYGGRELSQVHGWIIRAIITNVRWISNIDRVYNILLMNIIKPAIIGIIGYGL